MHKLKLKMGKIFELVHQLIKYVNGQKNLAKFISIGFVAFLFIYLYFSLKDETQLIIKSFSEFDIRNLGYSFFIYGVNFYIFFEIWRVILQGFGLGFSKVKLLKVYASTYLAKFIPSPIFLYASRITQLQKIGMSPKRSVAVTALEFIFQVAVGIIIYGLINIKIDQPITWLWILVIILFIGLFLSPNTFRKKFLKEVKNLNFDRRRMFVILILEIIPWLLGGLFFLFIYRNFYSPTSPIKLVDLLSIWIVANVSSLIGSYLFGGLGLLREFTLVLMLQKYFPPAISIIIAATVRVMLIVCGVIWALVVYFLSVLITKIYNSYNNIR